MKVNNQKETTTKEIAKNVFLHTSKMQLLNTEDLAHTLYTYTVDVKEVALVDITLDFTGSENIKIENQAGLTAQATIKPMSSQIIAVLRAYDVVWNTQCRIKLSKKSPSIEDQEAFIKDEIANQQREIEKANQHWKSFPQRIASHEQLLGHIKTTGTNFIDIAFPPVERSIFDPAKGQPFDRLVHWRRPREFMVPDPSKGLFEPQVFEKTIEPNDILQGNLGNCWFLCAVSCLAEMPSLVERLFITKDYNDEGVYRVKICKDGEWQEVVVDDYFPCLPQGPPIFSRGHGNELWALILEKAYSKLHGGYKNIVAGRPMEAMMDLTGCPTTSYSFKDDKVQELIRNGKLWTMMKTFDKEGYIMAAGTPGVDEFTENGGPDKQGGLVPGHAYSIIQAIEYKGIKLLNIRNPWGNFEWDGDWSDKSPLWTEDMIKGFNATFDDQDGQFWMSYEDFTKLFDSFEVCRVSNWDELRLRGRFIRYNDVTDPDNEVVVSKWIYALEVPAKTHLVIGLHQEDERIEGTLPRRSYLDFGIAILKREMEGSSLVQFKDLTQARDCEIECVLEPGSYIVVPRTTGCSIKRPLEAQPENIRLLNPQGQPHELFTSTIADIFRKFDLVVSNTIDYKELKAFYEIVGKRPITELDYQTQLLPKYNNYQGALTLKGFTEWFLDQTRAEGEDAIFGWLEKLGYDRDLYSVRSRLFNISFHSKVLENNGGQQNHMEVKIRDAIGTDVDNNVNRLVLQQFGKDIERGDGYRIIEKENEAVYSWTYGVSNESDHPIVFKLDFNESENLFYSTKGAHAKKLLQPRETWFMLHAQAGYGNFSKSISHEVQHLPRKK